MLLLFKAIELFCMLLVHVLKRQRPGICTTSIHYRGYFSRMLLSHVLDEQGVVVVVDDVVMIRCLLQLRVLLLG